MQRSDDDTRKRRKAGRRPSRWLPYADAALLVKTTGIATSKDYQSAARKSWREENRLPSNPGKVYSEWVGWDAFLARPDPLSYQEAKAIAQAAKLQSSLEYLSRDRREWRRRNRLPSDPSRVFKENWKGWDEFLGVERHIPYSTLKARARAAKLQSFHHYVPWARKNGLPLYPPRTYADEWEGWDVFLGRPTGYRVTESQRCSYHRAKQIVQATKIGSAADYAQRKEWRRRHYLPVSPAQAYAKEWEGWPTFLGEHYAPWGKHQDAATASARQERKRVLTLVRAAKLRTSYEYMSSALEEWRKENRLPDDPKTWFGDRWEGWRWFLGRSFDRVEEVETRRMLVRQRPFLP